MIYLLDANVLINANRTYYPIDRVPEFWEWLAFHGSLDNVKVPMEIYEEFDDSDDELSKWANQETIRRVLLFDGESDPALVDRVVQEGYAPDLTDIELGEVGRDPFLIAHGLASRNDRIVVTVEVSKPTKTRQNRQIPDVCLHFGLPCLNTFQLLEKLDFRTRRH